MSDVTAVSSGCVTDPHAEYTRRLEGWTARTAALDQRLAWLGNGRFLLFFVGLFFLLAGFGLKWFAPAWIGLPVLGFLGLSVAYQRAARDRYSAQVAAAYYARGLARLEDRWAGTGNSGDRFLDSEHPNAADLDLFGPGSVFELLCTTRTRPGEELLAAWLCAPASPEEVRKRQEAVQDLRSRLDLREELSGLGAVVPAGVDLQGLAEWGAAAPWPGALAARLSATVLAASSVVTFVLWAMEYTSVLPFLGAIAVQMSIALALRRRVRQILGPVEQRTRELLVFAGVLERIEREPVEAPRLQELRQALTTAGLQPSQLMARVYGLLELLDWRRNLYFAPFGALLMWTTHLACALERWRGKAGAAIGGWIAVVGQFEALCALAAFAYENPTYTFPEVINGPVCWEGEALGHPLLPRAACVTNSLTLNRTEAVFIVSGSNMSGKSTWLRTVGVNTVLALAGAPVRARRFRLTPVIVGGTLRIQDSLQAGRSRFFAEILRIRQLVDLARGASPLLFLLDEVLHGTNSHDRRHGAEAVVRGLVARGAVGLVTTHDLALTHIAEALAPHAVNVHFADRVVDGTITFDYTMRPGVVQHSNALALMRAVGLEV